jgi:hypothetical protein
VNPGIAHWEAVKRVFRYLKGTRELWLSYGGVTKEMEGYADADESMMEDRKAISGYAFIINGGVRGHSVYHVSSNSSRPAFLESIGLLSLL